MLGTPLINFKTLMPDQAETEFSKDIKIASYTVRTTDPTLENKTKIKNMYLYSQRPCLDNVHTLLMAGFVMD